MSHHKEMPPIPPASRSPKGGGSKRTAIKDQSRGKPTDNLAEQGETANIRQNTTNAGYFYGKRVK